MSDDDERFIIPRWRAAYSEIDRLKAELAAERAKGHEDTRRLDWMIETGAYVVGLSVWIDPCSEESRCWSGGDPRAAIDAGMTATG